jgi:Fic family protein
MVYNNYITISKIRELIDKPLTPELLKELQGSITKDTLDEPSYEGRFRTAEDRQVYVSDFEGNILHAPPPAQNIKEYIDLLCKFANEDKEEEFIHPVIKGIILHFWLAYIHPFNDGNGRTARAVFYWYMLKKNYWLFEYLSISNIILRVRTQYYRSFLYSEIDDGDMTYFIIFHLRAISTAIGQLKRYIKQKQEEARDVATQWSRYPSLNYRQKGVLNRGLANSEATFTFESHMRMYGVVHQTARTDLLGLVKAGLLEKNKKGRQFYFIPVKDLKDRLK